MRKWGEELNQTDRNIILIGMMGTGKSTVGHLISQQLNYTLVDLDSEIEKAVGKSIPAMFESEGEPFFRNAEADVLEKVLGRQRLVIATGGGAVLRKENCELMSSKGWVAALTADEAAIVQRVRGDVGRPLLAGNLVERVRQIMKERKECYQFADVTVDTTGKSAHEVALDILMHYRG
ncbi:shikimate kinase [Paenibacillus uliginis N3/975]|uniref:Shikimate kinase n=1 Tax=Paenibacillus uliginis N3/975 TaxID=1313296 RepID=A0A1X7HL22_9BACL|nr:shikimate kinase [Paenibacillus uliginis]SMF88020.1 shikimate kinase [Paenibacillus uliginis N3/975]